MCAIHLVDVELFYWINTNLDLLAVLDEKKEDCQSSPQMIHPLKTLNICKKKIDSYLDISLKIKTVNLMMALKEKSEYHHQYQVSLMHP